MFFITQTESVKEPTEQLITQTKSVNELTELFITQIESANVKRKNDKHEIDIKYLNIRLKNFKKSFKIQKSKT